MRNFNWEPGGSGGEETLDIQISRKPDDTVEVRNLKTSQSETYRSHDECVQAFSDMLDTE